MAGEAVPFLVEQVSRTAAYVLAGGVAVYAVGTGQMAWRGFRARLEDRWSAIVATLVMAGLAIMLAWRGADIFPAPFSVWALVVYAGAVVVTFTYTVSRMHDRIERFQTEFGARFNQLLERTLPEDRLEEIERLRAKWRADSEGRRKTPHLLMGLFLVFYGALGFWVLRGIWQATYGGDPAGGGEGVVNLHAATHAADGTWLVAGHVFGLLMMLLLLFVLAPTELLRLRYPETGYPFKHVILNNLRPKEKGLFGGHYYIAAALPLAALWLTRDTAAWDTGIPAVLAVLCVTVFADAASALVGVRFGRTKWPHHPGKSLQGTAAGVVVAFAVALPFVGPAVAAVAGAVFLAVDALAPVPFPVSDNLLNPLALAIAFTLADPWLEPMIAFY